MNEFFVYDFFLVVIVLDTGDITKYYKKYVIAIENDSYEIRT